MDRYHRLAAEADSEPVVVGSTGQPRPNGLYDLVSKVEAISAAITWARSRRQRRSLCPARVVRYS